MGVKRQTGNGKREMLQSVSLFTFSLPIAIGTAQYCDFHKSPH
jgi:hypothetical protein